LLFILQNHQFWGGQAHVLRRIFPPLSVMLWDN
jgi:hypothetical protein